MLTLQPCAKVKPTNKGIDKSVKTEYTYGGTKELVKKKIVSCRITKQDGWPDRQVHII